MLEARARVEAIVLAMLVSASGCCVPQPDPIWETQFKGTLYNFAGDAQYWEAPPSAPVAISRNAVPGIDAILLRTHMKAQIVVICHLPADSAHQGYASAQRASDGTLEAWLVRDPIRSIDTATQALLSTSADRRQQIPNAFRMKGEIRFEVFWEKRRTGRQQVWSEQEEVKTLTVSLQTIDPIPQIATVAYDKNCNPVLTTQPETRPSQAQPAAWVGEVNGRWVRYCKIVPFI